MARSSSTGPGTIIARGRNRREADGDPTAHAELVAIRAAARAVGGWRLDGLTLVVTLEPCTMCAGAVTTARLGRLVFGAADPRAGAVGSLWDVVRDQRLVPVPEVIGGVLADDCLAVHHEVLRRAPVTPESPFCPNVRYAHPRWSRLVAEGARLESV